MTQIKLVLVSINHPENWALPYVITPTGVMEFISSDGKTHQLRTKKGTDITHTGTLFQMVGYNPSAEEEEDQFLPVAIDQWSLCTKFCKRGPNGLLPNLAYHGVQYTITWQKAELINNQYSLFRKVDV